MQSPKKLYCSNLLYLFFAFLIALPSALAAGPDAVKKQYEDIKTRYFTLRNTDVNIARRKEWEQVGGRFESFAARYKSNPLAASALFNAAVVSEQIFFRFSETQVADHSCKLFLKLSLDYPQDRLADDSLVRCSDIRRKAGNIPEAERLLREVAHRFPSSDMVIIAAKKLAGDDDPDTNETTSGDENEAIKGYEREALRRGKPLIVIDPGHGGEDLGAVGDGDLFEKDIVLAIALELEKLLRKEMGAVVRLTRRRDRFVPLIERTAFANDFEASLFISLHLNASPSKKLHGIETYYLDNTGDKASRALAERENASTRFEGAQADLQYMLSDLIQNLKLEDSIRLAETLQTEMVRAVRSTNYKVLDLGVKKAPFYVLVGAHMPCVLAELSFIDHPEEGKLLATAKYQNALAFGLLRGIESYIIESSKRD